MLGAAVGLDVGDDLGLRSARRPAAPAGDFHQHVHSLTDEYDAAMAVAEDLEVAAFLRAQPKKLFIGGRWVESASGKTFETLDPATGQVLTRVAEAGAEDVDRAVAAARRSFDRVTRAGRSRRADHPVELPALDGGMEDRSGACVR